jgi:hypothetical protein
VSCLQIRYAGFAAVAVRDEGLGDGCSSHPWHHQLQQHCCNPRDVALGNGDWDCQVGCWVVCLFGGHLLVVVGQDGEVTVVLCYLD